MIRQDLKEEADKGNADLETLRFRHLHLARVLAEFDHMFSGYILVTFLWVITMTCSVIYSLIMMDITPAMKPIWFSGLLGGVAPIVIIIAIGTALNEMVIHIIELTL
jgi:hypothetical protein